jgi:DNA-binding CsgD family transcriptional regulator
LTDVATETAAALLERESELKEFGIALAEAHQGHGRVVFVEAAAGLGKTSLLNAASGEAAEAGFLCLRARATELERDFAYGCVRQLLEPAVARVSSPERKRLFEGAACLSEPLLAPSAIRLETPSADSAVSIRHGLYWLLNNLADESAVVLSIDDLHWADAESIRFLNYLAPRLDGLPLGVLVSTRSGETVTPDIARLATGPGTTVLRPRPLSLEATATLCEQRLGSAIAEDFAAACREATGGNPLSLEALLREAKYQEIPADSRGADRVRRIAPAAVAQAVLLRLSGAPAAATALVRAAAVLGDGASLAEAASLAEVGEDEAARAADVLISLVILKPGARLEFAHPIVREAVYADIGSHERAEAHARAARILIARGASEERVAAQLFQAEPAADAERVAIFRRVAADAVARGAPSAAVAWLRRALAEPPAMASRAEMLLELGAAEFRLGEPQSVDHLRAAVEQIRDPALLTASTLQLTNALVMSGDVDAALRAIEAAIELVEPHDRERALLLEAELAANAQLAGLEARAPAASRLERHADLEGRTPGERLVLASLAFERARASESATEAAAYIEGALSGGRLALEHESDVVGPFYTLVRGLLATDALDLAQSCVEQALADARSRASIPPQGYLIAHLAWVSFRRGAVAQAETDARTAYELLTAHHIVQGARRFAMTPLIEGLIEGGELEAAERSLRDSGLGEDIPPEAPSNGLLRARGLLAIAQGSTEQGVADLIEFGLRDELFGDANPIASRWRSRASLALAAAGDGERAHMMASDDLERARRWGAASGIGIALRAVGLVEGGTRSVDRLREAVDMLKGSPARLEHARALIDLGAALRRANRRKEARSVLQDGLELAVQCGARPLAERARTESRAAGRRSSDPTGTGLEQLTASERRVAELAAEGHSNPEIAQALFVTRKTIETHLGHVYSKLDISGRGELEHVLADQSPRAETGAVGYLSAASPIGE